MPKLHLTNRALTRLRAPDPSGKDVLHWDDDLKGFGLRCSGTTNTKMYVVQRDIGGKARRVNVGTVHELTLDEARQRAADLLLQMRQGIDPKQKAAAVPTLASTLTGYLAARNLRPGSIRMYRQIERTLADWLDLPLTAITADMVENKHRALVGINPNYKGEVTANYAMRTLSLLWNYAADRTTDLPPNPVRRLRRGGLFAEPRRTRMVKAEDLPAFYQAVLALPNPVARDLVLLLTFTGLRWTEAASLRWADVDLTERVIRLPANRTKGKRQLNLPMSNYVRDLLVTRRAIGNAGGYVFPGRNGHLKNAPWTLLGQAVGHRISAHDLRRGFITVATYTPGIPPYAVKEMVNHAAGGDVTAGYVQADMAALRAAVDRVADRLVALCAIAPIGGANVARFG